MDPLPAFILILLIIASSFFSLSSAALTLARKGRLRILAGGREHIIKKTERIDTLIFSLRIWNLIARFAGAVYVMLFIPSILNSILYVAALVLAYIIFSEALPRLIASFNPEKITLALLTVLSVLAVPWIPLYLLASCFSVKHDNSEEEFLEALEEGEKTGAVESRERSMVEGVLYLGDRPASAFMTHRSEIECLDLDASLDEVKEKTLACRSQGFFPVIRGTPDNIAGVVTVQDILATLAQLDGENSWKGLAALMKKPRFIPETLSALKAFEVFGLENENYLFVIDEYGGFAGHLRIRNLIDEIIGEKGGYQGKASEPPPVCLQEDGTWLADGNINLDELAEEPGLEALGQEQSRTYHTLAGFILKLAGDIPQAGDTFTWENFQFKVLDLDGNRIDKVQISKNRE